MMAISGEGQCLVPLHLRGRRTIVPFWQTGGCPGSIPDAILDIAENCSMGLPLVLTLKLDQTTFEPFNQLRQQHFPPDRNFLSAHVTLFHALSGEEETQIQQELAAVCSRTPRLPLQFPTLRFLGRGVAIEVQSSELIHLRQSLAKTWGTWLTAQDQQGYRPHITIQNKVPAQTARQLYDQLLQDWQSIDGYGEGLLLWHYQGGPWTLAGEFLFLE